MQKLSDVRNKIEYTAYVVGGGGTMLVSSKRFQTMPDTETLSELLVRYNYTKLPAYRSQRVFIVKVVTEAVGADGGMFTVSAERIEATAARLERNGGLGFGASAEPE